MMIENHWYLVSSHGAVLFHIAVNPDCTIGEISESMALTRRTVWGLIGDLRRAGMLQVWRDGRHHHYRVDPDGPFLHPTIEGVKLGSVLGEMTNGSRHEERAI